MTGPGDLLLSLLMLAAGGLTAGAYALWRRSGERQRPALMLACAAVLVANVLIWTI